MDAISKLLLAWEDHGDIWFSIRRWDEIYFITNWIRFPRRKEEPSTMSPTPDVWLRSSVSSSAQPVFGRHRFESRRSSNYLQASFLQLPFPNSWICLTDKHPQLNLTWNGVLLFTATWPSFQLFPWVPFLVHTGWAGICCPRFIYKFNVSTCCPCMWYQNCKQTMLLSLPIVAGTIALSRIAVSFCLCHDVSIYT